MTDHATPEEYGLRAAKRQLKKDNASLVEQNLALRSKVSVLATQLKAAQKVVEAARELDWDSYAEGQGKPEVDLSGLWDSLAAQLEAAQKRERGLRDSLGAAPHPNLVSHPVYTVWYESSRDALAQEVKQKPELPDPDEVGYA